jgi:hypothetical protein
MTQSTPTVPDWPRPHHKPSPSKASLFYLVFGEPPADLNISRARHHVDQLPPELRVSIHARGDDPAWFDAWFSPPVGLEMPHVFGEEAPKVAAAGRVAAVRAEFNDPESLAYLRNTVGVVSAIAEQGAVAIFDVQALTWWRPEGWRRRFVDRSEFAIGDHIFTAVSRDPGDESKTSLRTRGMKKFGRPDLLVRHLPGPADVDSPSVAHAAEVVDGLANYLARGGILSDGETMHLARYDSSIVFFEAPQLRRKSDPDERPPLEISDINSQTGLSGEGIPHLLAKMDAPPGE